MGRETRLSLLTTTEAETVKGLLAVDTDRLVRFLGSQLRAVYVRGVTAEQQGHERTRKLQEEAHNLKIGIHIAALSYDPLAAKQPSREHTRDQLSNVARASAALAAAIAACQTTALAELSAAFDASGPRRSGKLPSDPRDARVVRAIGRLTPGFVQRGMSAEAARDAALISYGIWRANAQPTAATLGSTTTLVFQLATASKSAVKAAAKRPVCPEAERQAKRDTQTNHSAALATGIAEAAHAAFVRITNTPASYRPGGAFVSFLAALFTELGIEDSAHSRARIVVKAYKASD